MDSATKRPWYRLHWQTCVLVTILVAALIYREREDYLPSVAVGNNYWKTSYSGWPLAFVKIDESGSLVGPALPAFKYTWQGSSLVADLLVCCLLVVSLVHLSERFLRSNRRMQFSLQSLLHVTSVVAILLTVISSELIFESGFSIRSPRHLVHWDELRNIPTWPILLAMACAIYSLGWLTCYAVLGGWSLLCRPRT